MEDLKLEITIKPLPNGKFNIITDFPEGANIALVCSHLDNVSNGLKKMVTEKVDESQFRNKAQAIKFSNSLTIQDLL